MVDGRNVFIPRYFIVLNPYCIVLFVLGFETFLQILGSKLLRTVAFGLPLAFAVFFVNGYKYAKPAWKKMSEIAIRENVKVVYTSRGRTFSMPYYFKAGIPVENFVYDSDFIDTLVEKLKTDRPIMIVDNLMARESYLKYLLIDLQHEGVITESHEAIEPGTEPVFSLVLHGIRKNKQ
jgi:hypothetical protein